jgi:hypothetical protein
MNTCIELDINKLNFIKIIDSYLHKEIIKQILDLDIYKDINNLKLLDKFVSELYDDFYPICVKYKFCDFIKTLFKQNQCSFTLTYHKIFNDILSFNKFGVYANFFELDLTSFEKIITKYSNVKLSNKLIPLDPLTKIILSDDDFSLGTIMLNLIINNIKPLEQLQINKKIEQNKLEFIMKFVNKDNNYISNLLYKNIDHYSERRILSNTIKEKNNYLTNKNYIDIPNDITTNRQLVFVLVKLLIINNVYNNFTEILDIIYSCSYIYIIEMLSILKPMLLDINLELFKKIIYYGRFDVFEILYFHIPHKILSILKISNPFDLKGVDFCYINDINGGSFWENNECDKIVIGKKQHFELIDIILSISSEKKYVHVNFTDEIKRHWIEMSIENESLSNDTISNEYFASYDELIKLFKLEFDFKHKNSIKNHIELFGKEKTWDIIKSRCDEDFLNLLY